MDYNNKINNNSPTGTPIQGESALWDGPLDQRGRPHSPGSSTGPNGMQVLKYPVPYESKPITECAKKGRYHEDYL